MKPSDWIVLLLVIAGSMDTAALGARISGAEIPPWMVFALVVGGAPIPLVLAILPQFGVRSVTLPAQVVPVPIPEAPGQSTAVVVAHPDHEIPPPDPAKENPQP